MIWTIQFVLLVIAVAFITFQLVNIVERWKHKGIMERDIADSYTMKFFKALRDMFLIKNRCANVYYAH